HPDTVAPGNAYLRQVAAEAFKDLSEAKAILLNPTEREKYDAKLSFARATDQGKTGSPPSSHGSANARTATDGRGPRQASRPAGGGPPVGPPIGTWWRPDPPSR